MLEQLKQHWQQTLDKLKASLEQSKTTEATEEPDKQPQVTEDDLLYPLVQLTAEQKGWDITHASWHPFINFLVNKRRQIEAEDPKSWVKIVANFESFLSQLSDKALSDAFFTYFASKQGLLLFRCQPISIRYFSRMMVKFSANPERLLKALEFLNNPAHFHRAGGLDELIHQAFAE